MFLQLLKGYIYIATSASFTPTGFSHTSTITVSSVSIINAPPSSSPSFFVVNPSVFKSRLVRTPSRAVPRQLPPRWRPHPKTPPRTRLLSSHPPRKTQTTANTSPGLFLGFLSMRLMSLSSLPTFHSLGCFRSIDFHSSRVVSSQSEHLFPL